MDTIRSTPIHRACDHPNIPYSFPSAARVRNDVEHCSGVVLQLIPAYRSELNRWTIRQSIVDARNGPNGCAIPIRISCKRMTRQKKQGQHYHQQQCTHEHAPLLYSKRGPRTSLRSRPDLFPDIFSQAHVSIKLSFLEPLIDG